MAHRGGSTATAPVVWWMATLRAFRPPQGTRTTTSFCQIQADEGIFSGPTCLVTFRDIGIQGGVMFPVWSQLNGTQPAEGFRSYIGISYFFLKGRK